MSRAGFRSVFWIVGAFASLGCNVPVATDLEESDANRVMVALDEGGVAAIKELDPGRDGRWRVAVPAGDGSQAAALLERRNLPPRAAPGVLDALGEGSIVPSRTSERARLIAGTAGELERSLRGVDGVPAPRVHLAVPIDDALVARDAPQTPTASVLLRHRGATPPLAETDVQRLIAGAVPGLTPDRVSVVVTPVADPTTPQEPKLARVGPIAVTRTSLAALRIAMGTSVAIHLGLLALVVMMWLRLRRSQVVLDDLRAQSSATRPDPLTP